MALRFLLLYAVEKVNAQSTQHPRKPAESAALKAEHVALVAHGAAGAGALMKVYAM